jgi:hypothetical protein
MPGRTITRTGLVIDWTEHLDPTVHGNPRWRVHFTDETVAVTQSDMPCATGIDDARFRNTPLAVTFTRTGRIARVSRQPHEQEH